jgi:hypothetical protein
MPPLQRSSLRPTLLLALCVCALTLGGAFTGPPDCNTRPSTQGGPDHNHNGVEDALDIARGVSLDLNGDGCPDECNVPR